MLSKKQSRLALIKQLSPLLECPHCGQALKADDAGVSCPAGHRIDAAKQGQLFLLRKQPPETYTAALFAARTRVIQAGVYKALHEVLQEQLQDSRVIVDAGCGEGSHAEALQQGTIIGIDNAKAGIDAAAKRSDRHLWLMGDLADPPLVPQCADAVLNVLSPANYAAFARILKPGGLLIKVTPGPRYLQEIRDADGTEAGQPEPVTMPPSFALEETNHVHVTVDLPVDLRKEMLRMTPLTWHMEEEALVKAASTLSAVTIDLLVHRAVCKP
ncbi:methyltransferase domain-containing protein [Alkalicoccus chagannorensis]|uniref:methyltransferase domain-containing protein n=1 Tax=Alkalicoccus chagannorensis TaxID=427072 RepID=UPI000685689C|nr:methyltransferase domain-containing protein [Alkalicoccus chagannorensis]